MKVFLLCGKAGSGKNEVAALIKKNSLRVGITSLAKYIKLFALEMTNWDYSDETKPRAFLQNMGDRMRAVREDFLTKRIIEDLSIYEQFYDILVISDVRLKSEIEYFKNQSDLDVFVVKIDSLYQKRSLSNEEKIHKTETELDSYTDYDYVLVNDFTENLEKEVIKMLEGMK